MPIRVQSDKIGSETFFQKGSLRLTSSKAKWYKRFPAGLAAE